MHPDGSLPTEEQPENNVDQPRVKRYRAARDEEEQNDLLAAAAADEEEYVVVLNSLTI